MNTEHAVEVAKILIRKWESLRLRPYLCPAGVPTIGYGATYYEDGTRVTLKDDPITKERAEALMVWMVKTVYLPTVLKLCPNIDSPERLAAIIDFTFNLGSARLATSNLRRRINAGEWEKVPKELRKWVWASGKPLKGLKLRREDEIKLTLE